MENRKGYKGFAPGMVCRGKQYAENTVFEEQGANDCCEAGVMHYCENPLDVLNYYPLIDSEGRVVEIAEVEPLAEVLRKDDRCATKKLKIGAKLNLKDFIKASIEVMFEKAKDKDSGDYAKLASSGKHSIVAGIGANNIAKAALGNWIVLAEWRWDADNNYTPKCVKAVQVDGEKIKADTWYKLVDGEFVEA